MNALCFDELGTQLRAGAFEARRQVLDLHHQGFQAFRRIVGVDHA